MDQHKTFDLAYTDASNKVHLVEYKRFIPPKHSLSQTISTIAAAANTAGGVIMIGVDETGKAVGLRFAEDNAKFLQKVIEEQLGLHPPAVSVNVKDQSGTKFIEIGIQKQPAPVVQKSEAAVYVIRDEQPVALSKEDLKSKVAELNPAQTNDFLKSLLDSIDNLRTELAKSQSWRHQWKGWLVGFISAGFIVVFGWFLTNLSNEALEKHREQVEKQKLAAEVRPYLEIVFQLRNSPSGLVSAQSMEASKIWNDLSKVGSNKSLTRRRFVYLEIINHGRGAAIDVKVPLTIKVWGHANFTRENPYIFDVSESFRNIEPGERLESERGIEVTYFPYFKIEKSPLKVKGLPELTAVPDMEIELHSSLAFESSQF